MAIKDGFFDASLNAETGLYDRIYLSDDMASFFNAITGNGVFKNVGNALKVVPSEAGMSVNVSTGFATAYGRYINNTEPYTIYLESANEQARIDIIVARLSVLQNERNFTLIVKTGTPALSPVAPSLVRNESVYELCLAKVTVQNNTLSITSEMIEDTRGDSELCGFVSGLGGGAEFTDCTINSEEETYSSTWLLDENGNEFQPEAKKVYRVITDGKYNNCIYLYNQNTSTYEGVGSYNIELTAEEALELWNNSPTSRLSNIPTPDGVVQYTGYNVSPNWLYYDPTKIRIGGVTSAINAGNYYATFEPINGYAWSDGTTDVKNVMWTVNKKIIPIPIPMQTMFNYDGNQKRVVFNNLDTDSITITNASATNIGTYNVTATLNDINNTVWADGTYVQRTWEYRVVGMQNIIVLSKSSVTFDEATDTDTVTVISSSSGGAVSVESTDNSIVQASVIGDVITLVPGYNAQKGSADVVVTVEGSSTYEQGTAIISVVKDYGIKVVSWANGTDTEIADMVAAADRGEIDLHDYWHVGDEREVILSAISGEIEQQSQTLVLMDTDHYELTTPVLDKYKQTRNKCSFVVGCKNALHQSRNISYTSTGIVVWNDGDLRAWLNTNIILAMPSALSSIFKSFKAGVLNSTCDAVQYNDDLFSLFADREVFDEYNSSYGSYRAIEWEVLSQIEWYKNSTNNRIKKQGNNGNVTEWFTRTLMNTGAGNAPTKYVVVSKTGERVQDSTASSGYCPVNKFNGIAPFGCI